MNRQLLEILICPSCKGNIQLFVFESKDADNGHKAADAKGQEVLSGLLKCQCESVYPIIEGVPSFLSGGLKQFPAFMERHRSHLEKICAFPQEK